MQILQGKSIFRVSSIHCTTKKNEADVDDKYEEEKSLFKNGKIEKKMNKIIFDVIN